MQDVEKRLNALPNVSMPMDMNVPRQMHDDPLDTMVDMQWLGPPIKLVETHDNLGGNGGAFCYVYV